MISELDPLVFYRGHHDGCFGFLRIRSSAKDRKFNPVDLLPCMFFLSAGPTSQGGR